MRILLISQYFFPEQFSNNAIAKELVRRGHEVDAVTCVPNYPAGKFFDGYSNRSKRNERWNDVNIHRAFTVARGKRSLSLIANYLTFPVAASWTMIRRLKTKPAVSFVSMPSPLLQALAGIFLKKWRGVPCVYWVQDIWPESAVYTLGIRNRFVIAVLNAVCGWIYRQADLVLVQSNGFPPMIERFGVSRSRIRVFPNTAPDTYRPVSPTAAPEQAQLIRLAGFRLMFAGNIGESQDFDNLVEAVDLLDDATDLLVVIIGSGRDEERVKRKIAERGLQKRFQFLGRHPEETMPLFFAHADALLVSLKDTPIFSLTVPYKVQCYMACGKPIIAALNGEGAKIITESGAGLVAKASDPETLAANIRTMMQEPKDRVALMGARGRQYFDEHFAADKVYDKLELWLKEAAGKGDGMP
ncbi:glycosyltransferase family 4 protein [Neorhizobium sp. NPDC001467]|uniref:glycosyltransferase family 4 protein n=1 Tax=Neorhizobium sp. NPDC001467 TaxID=3390595 RepID=UPI003D060B53